MAMCYTNCKVDFEVRGWTPNFVDDTLQWVKSYLQRCIFFRIFSTMENASEMILEENEIPSTCFPPKNKTVVLLLEVFISCCAQVFFFFRKFALVKKERNESKRERTEKNHFWFQLFYSLWWKIIIVKWKDLTREIVGESRKIRKEEKQEKKNDHQARFVGFHIQTIHIDDFIDLFFLHWKRKNRKSSATLTSKPRRYWK